MVFAGSRDAGCADGSLLRLLQSHHVVLCTGSKNKSTSGPTKSSSSLDFGEIVLASSFGRRQGRSKTKQIWVYPVCADVCAITAGLQIVLRYSLKRLLRNVYSHYTHSSVNTPLKQM